MFFELFYPYVEIFVAPKIVMQYTFVSGKGQCKKANVTACQNLQGTISAKNADKL